MPEECDVLIVGGGPAGSTCAWRLRHAGMNVAIVDRAEFPRDKVCAGWITPQVVTALNLDTQAYARGRTFQPIDGFRAGIIGRERDVEVTYDRPVSYGIRRCEFDEYLLRRSEARLHLGEPVSRIERAGARWIVNGRLAARMLVGAGGHFCPVARWLNKGLGGARVVAAQEVELPIADGEASAWTTRATMPELFFCPDLDGYGWCFRKGQYVNVGIGRFGRSLPRATAEFVSYLRARHKIPPNRSWRWRGHAYLVAEPPRRRTSADGVILIGDAAGLAYSQSGEGIRPAIESGLLAAETILGAKGRYTCEGLAPYERRLSDRFGLRNSRPTRFAVPASVSRAVFPFFLAVPALVRHVLLNRWFLHAHQPAMVPSVLGPMCVADR